jgi:hypothetical protein
MGGTTYDTYKASCTPQPVANAGQDFTITKGQSALIGAPATDPGATVVWSPATGLDNPNSPNPKATPTVTTLYTVTVKNACGTAASQMQVTVK